ncbi:hypothetical protein [Selenomonas sp. AB3002]|uniref:hypothetical protein n=1 Tax=Selenomonas sp. AB3002 TaxID=1392502 RepID=UPI0004986B3F
MFSAGRYLYYRGFYIVKNDVVLPNFDRYNIDGEYSLFVHCEQTIKEVKNDKMKLWVIGIFYNLDGFQLEDVKRFEDLEGILYNTCGRYIIVVLCDKEIRIYGDPSNSMSYCYSIKSDVVASSSKLCAFLSNDMEKSDIDRIYQQLGLTKGFGYITNETSYKDVFWGIPNFYLNMLQKRLVRFFPNHKNPFMGLSIGECVLEIQKNMQKQIHFLKSICSNIVMEITGGG